MSDRFVATDADGEQHHEGHRRTWPLPVRDAQGWQPGGVVEPDEHGDPVILDASQLLEQLGECIFVAEAASGAGAARLVSGTGWSEKSAATFGATRLTTHEFDAPVPQGTVVPLPTG